MNDSFDKKNKGPGSVDAYENHMKQLLGCLTESMQHGNSSSFTQMQFDRSLQELYERQIGRHKKPAEVPQSKEVQGPIMQTHDDIQQTLAGIQIYLPTLPERASSKTPLLDFVTHPEDYQNLYHFVEDFEGKYEIEAEKLGLFFDWELEFEIPDQLSLELISFMRDEFGLVLAGFPHPTQMAPSRHNLQVLYPDRHFTWYKHKGGLSYGTEFLKEMSRDFGKKKTTQLRGYEQPGFGGRLFFVEQPRIYSTNDPTQDPFSFLFPKQNMKNISHRCHTWIKLLKVRKNIENYINNYCKRQGMDVHFSVVFAPVCNLVKRLYFPELDDEIMPQEITGRKFNPFSNCVLLTGGRGKSKLSQFSYTKIDKPARFDYWTTSFAFILER